MHHRRTTLALGSIHRASVLEPVESLVVTDIELEQPVEIAAIIAVLAAVSVVASDHQSSHGLLVCELDLERDLDSDRSQSLELGSREYSTTHESFVDSRRSSSILQHRRHRGLVVIVAQQAADLMGRRLPLRH